MSACNRSISPSQPSSSTSSSLSNPSTPSSFQHSSAQLLSSSRTIFGTSPPTGSVALNGEHTLNAPIALADVEEYIEEEDANEKLLKPSTKIASPSTVIFIHNSQSGSSCSDGVPVILRSSTTTNNNNNSTVANNENNNSMTTMATSITATATATAAAAAAANGTAIVNGNSSSFIVSLNQKLNGARQWWNGNGSTPTTNGNALVKRPKNVELFWRNLSYDVARFKWANYVRAPCSVAAGYENRRLLDSISGSIRSGELIAIMGPSGAGKTTLIECISGRRKIGVTGQIVVSGGGKRTKLAYNAQDDSLMPCLTVYETLLFASQLRNYQRNNRLKVKLVDDNDNVYNATTYPDSDLIISLTDEAYHRNLVNSIIQKLGLESCKHVRAENCSGGQQKRLSIALELIHSPTILILDEPTSGLDSVSCHQCVKLLRDLAHNSEQPMAIAASIHQPTARILQNFDRIYVIAVNGQCIYDGPTDQLVAYLSRFNLTCPTYHNPADFVVEIASTDYGTEVTKQLVQMQRIRHQQNESDGVLVINNNNNNDSNAPPKYAPLAIEVATKETSFVEEDDEECDEEEDDELDQKKEDKELARYWPDETSDIVSIGKICRRSRKQVKRRELYKTWILWTRCLRLSSRDPTEYFMRAFACVAIIFLNIILYYDSNIGSADGCSQDSLLHLMENLKSDYNSNKTFAMTDTFLEGPGAQAILNFGFVFFAIIFVAFLSMMPVILTFPMEVGVFYKEYFNGWYSFSSYFVAKNLTNLLPAILVPIIFGASAYMITGQIWEQWRFFYFITILVLIALVADGVGIAISALFVHNVNAASIFAAIAQIPMLLFTGLLVQINTLPSFIRPFTYLSYYRLCFESALITLYGYGRCQRPKVFDMKEVRRLLGDDVEEVMECVGQHVSFFGSDSQGSLFNKFDRFMNQVDKQNPSLIMKNFNLHDEDLHFEMALLAVYAVIARLIAYVVLYRKANAQK